MPTVPTGYSEQIDYTDDLELALALADAADVISLGRFAAGDLIVESKPDLTPVTDADRAVEESLTARLNQARPGDAIQGEEFGTSAATGPATAAGTGRRWVIDPIDGTKNYVRGVPVWATLISLLDGDEAVVGVVSAPALGRRWWAATGTGAWTTSTTWTTPATPAAGEPRRIEVSKVSRLADASLSYASLGGWRERGKFAEFVELTQQVWRSRAYGDFWSYMLLAEGAVDLAAEPELSLWDVAALAPIVIEAGGRFTGLNGLAGVHHGNAAASNGLLHDALLAAIGD
ncbi:MAG TPA: inositol monophosphatase family protein [Jatrophihabitantaceae bacterium]|nr:inositol monophosphatase family protein [Jatrophihabitantaceae bacterium]